MPLLELPNYSFSNVTDPVKTEQNVYELMFREENKGLLPDNLLYVAFPIADCLNKHGINEAQRVINVLETYESLKQFKKLYVCQHILVKKLNFYDNIVFTPHTLNSDSFKSIPHYNSLIKKEHYNKPSSRSYDYSFMGAFNSHYTRLKLKSLEQENCPIIDTGAWHYYKSEQDRELNTFQYIEMLCNSKLSLCPEGTGVSTIRLYESMAAGSIPVVFNDIKVPSYLEEFIIRFDSSELDSPIVKDKLSNIKIPDDFYDKLYETYWNNLDNSRILEYILENV